MKRFFVIWVFMCFSLATIAQEEMRIVDSLKNVMAQQEGPEKVETMAELSRAFYDISFGDCISYGEAAVEEAERLKDDELVAWALWKLGIRYMDHYDFDLSHECFEQAVTILRKRKNGDGQQYLDMLNYKGKVELLMGELDLALSTFMKALEYSELFEDEMNYADVTNNLAYIYFYQDDLDKALEYFEDAHRRYVLLQDSLSAVQCENNISNIYVLRQQYDEAQIVLQKIIPFFEQYEDEASLAHAYQNLGTVYAIGNVNLDSALYYLQKSVVCAENVGDEVTLIEDEIETANVLNRLGYEKEALGLYQSALHSSEAMGYMQGVLEAYKHLGIHYNEVGDFTTSAVYLKRCMDLAEEKGNQLYANTVRPYLIADYAHLGHFAEMKKELGLLQDDYVSVFSESDELSEELAHLKDNAEGLLQQYESQNEQIQTLQTQRNQYRLAFFGLLAIALFSLVLMIAYKIVRKKRTKV